jgi:hypothetical protein
MALARAASKPPTVGFRHQVPDSGSEASDLVCPALGGARVVAMERRLPAVPAAREGVRLGVRQVDPVVLQLGADDGDAGFDVRQPIGEGDPRLTLRKRRRF